MNALAPVGLQVPDDPGLLDRMMVDLARCDPLYRPTNYWAFYERHFLPELRRRGLHDFRRRRHSVLSSFGATDLRTRGVVEVSKNVPASARIAWVLNGLIEAVPAISLGVWGINPEAVTRYFHRYVKEKFNRAGLLLDCCPTTAFGNPEDLVDIDGGRWSMSHLQYCSMFVDALEHMLLPPEPVVAELGVGLGRNLEVIARLFPTATLLAFDIPPQLYVSNQYLLSALGERVIGYEDAVHLAPSVGLPVQVKGRVVMLPSWRLSDWSDVHADLFWNSASFQEMEPPVVANYLQLVKRMSTDWVYINALPAGNYWGEWKPRRGGTREPVHYRLYDDALGQDYHLHDTYPTDYFLREGDYVSYIYRKCIG